MKQTVSYKAYITNKRLSLQPTLDIYREAVSFIVDVIYLEWDTFKGLTLKETYNKDYNADLNAAYNIGARYFIREYNKTIPEKVWLPAEAKVPEAGKRTLCTLSTLIRLVAALKEDSSAA